jgi:hypothetical protein
MHICDEYKSTLSQQMTFDWHDLFIVILVQDWFKHFSPSSIFLVVVIIRTYHTSPTITTLF